MWLPEHQMEFDKLKKILTSGLVVRHFDSTKPVFFSLMPLSCLVLGMLLATSSSVAQGGGHLITTIRHNEKPNSTTRHDLVSKGHK